MNSFTSGRVKPCSSPCRNFSGTWVLNAVLLQNPGTGRDDAALSQCMCGPEFRGHLGVRTRPLPRVEAVPTWAPTDGHQGASVPPRPVCPLVTQTHRHTRGQALALEEQSGSRGWGPILSLGGGSDVTVTSAGVRGQREAGQTEPPPIRSSLCAGRAPFGGPHPALGMNQLPSSSGSRWRHVDKWAEATVAPWASQRPKCPPRPGHAVGRAECPRQLGTLVLLGSQVRSGCCRADACPPAPRNQGSGLVRPQGSIRGALPAPRPLFGVCYESKVTVSNDFLLTSPQQNASFRFVLSFPW